MGSSKRVIVRPRNGKADPRERVIANALAQVANELRFTDVAELIGLIRNDEAANLADVVNSSTELFYKSGALRYALSASFDARWESTPEVAFDLEFRHQSVSAFFRLIIGRRRAVVEVLDVLFDEAELDEPARVARLADAFASARVLGPGRQDGS